MEQVLQGRSLPPGTAEEGLKYETLARYVKKRGKL